MFNSKFGIGVLKHPGYNGKGDPPAPAPTTSTSYSTNVPEYAEPYVKNMLNAAQAQIYNPSMTGFNPYVPYSNNPADYVASASPMQQQAFSTAANMQVPGQYGFATGATMGAMGGLGNVGARMGNAGYDYAMQAINPYATQAYMNPYLQASLAPQLQLANQQYDIAGQQQQSRAAQQGAFGGSREALMAGLNRQNQMLAQNQIIGQGYNRAFDAAQQAQQFGANLGLQGQQGQLQALQGMLGGANQLAGIGGSQLAAQQGIANLQNQFGQQQQQQQQNIINQAVQNYATAQQYPFMQLGLLNSMLRGLPMQQSSTQMYQAPPNPLTQLAGLGATAYGMSQAGKKSGGVIKAAGGIPMSRFNQEQLNKVQKSPYSTPLAKVVATGELGLQNYIKANPESKNVFAQLPPPQQAPQQMPQQMAMMPQNRIGLDTIATDDMTQMAGGGIIAFADEGLVPKASLIDTSLIPRSKSGEIDWNEMYARSVLAGQDMGAEKATKAQREALEKGIKDREAQMGSDKWTMLGLNLLKQTSPFAGVNAGAAGLETLDYMAKQRGLNAADRKLLLEQTVEASKADQARNIQERNALANVIASETNKKIGLAQIKSNQDLQNALKDEQLTEKADNNFKGRVDAEEKRILASTKYKGYTPDYIRALAYNNTVRDTSPKILSRLGHSMIPADQMPPPKPIVAPEPPGIMDRIGDKVSNYLFGPSSNAAPAGPRAGDTKVIGNVTYQYDGKGWLPR